MTVSLPSDLQPFVDQLVAAGSYPSADAVIADAVRRLRDSQIDFEQLKASFDEAVAELERTGGTPLDFKEIKRKAREYAAAQRRS